MERLKVTPHASFQELFHCDIDQHREIWALICIGEIASRRATSDPTSNGRLDKPDSEETVVTSARILVVRKFCQLPSCRHNAFVECQIEPWKADRYLAIKPMQMWNELPGSIMLIS